MELTVGQIARFMEEWAPLSYGESYDNPGLLIGRPEQSVSKILVAVDASESVIQQAVDMGADLLLTHHPLLFYPIKKITGADRMGSRLLTLIENKIALYSAHTNLDTAPNGNNDRAAALLGLEQVIAVGEEGEQACLRIGVLSQPKTLAEVAQQVKERFYLDSVRLYGDPEREVQRVAICTGSGMDFMRLALQKKADVLITGDITYHKADDAVAAGMGLIDATHFGTDRLSVEWVAQALQELGQSLKCDLQVTVAAERELYQVI